MAHIVCKNYWMVTSQCKQGCGLQLAMKVQKSLQLGFCRHLFAVAARTSFDELHLERLASGDLVLVDFQTFDADDSNNDAILVPRSINGSGLNFPYWSVIVHPNNFALHIIQCSTLYL